MRDMHKYPEIRIKNGWLLRANASVHLHKLWAKKDDDLINHDGIDSKVESYSKEWRKFEGKTLEGMANITGLGFRQNIIDVYIAPWFYAFSDPMVLGVIHKPDVFVDVLTHELLHRLLTDNTTVLYDTNLVKEWQKMFGEQPTRTALLHIPVHAVHKAIYLDVLEAPERLERDIEDCKKFDKKADSYVAAWDYVEKYGYENIIKQLKNSYRGLAKISK